MRMMRLHIAVNADFVVSSSSRSSSSFEETITSAFLLVDAVIDN